MRDKKRLDGGENKGGGNLWAFLYQQRALKGESAEGQPSKDEGHKEASRGLDFQGKIIPLRLNNTLAP